MKTISWLSVAIFVILLLLIVTQACGCGGDAVYDMDQPQYGKDDTSHSTIGNHQIITFQGYRGAFSILHDPDCTHDGSGLMRDYQIELTEDHYVIYDKDRIVGVIRYSNTLLDSLFQRDNE